jgi:hypothetical protein
MQGDVEWSTETEQELGFRYDVLDKYAADGYRPENFTHYRGIRLSQV